MGTGTRVGTGMRTNTGISTGLGVGARVGAGAGTKIEMRMEGRESLETSEKVTEAGRKAREGTLGQRVTSNYSRKTRRPSAIVASCVGPGSRNRRRGTGSGRVEERRK